MAVHLLVEGGPYRGVSPSDVARRARAMLSALQLADSELSIVLTGDDQIKKLNRIYRDNDRPTDVLAFPQDGTGKGRLLGDVVLSVPTARRQAEERGEDVVSELTMLLAHGLLHLVGWDHETARKDARMRRETRRLCAEAEGAPRPRRSPPAPLRGRGPTLRRDRTPLKGRSHPVANSDSSRGRMPRRPR